MKKITYNLYLICFLYFISTQIASAYLDPNSGSMVLQVILAAIFGFICTFKAWLNKVKVLFSKKKNNESNEE